ncbi:putative UDP-rhamnose:rhamnosyltransferase 1 [Telopea speciosissima]|uniref:putative UDP-rhamnose:rhamnosyltransferase 1 n=1 Tax=Telopea speciosissima TaxID=54955 RepID=UPI001CC50EEF|nr:putative UDP-rhamnose:rhamnosyltransferase 1 [Telopea speciosissima]
MAQRNGLHIVMFPWLAFGHMIPFLDLSKGLAKRGHQISFISTPRNIDRLPKLPPNLSPLINFVKLTLPQVTNLPEGAEATSDVPFNKTQYLKKAFDGLEGSFGCFLENSSAPPDLIIHDFSHHWLQPLAAKHGIPCAFFSIFNASVLAFFGSPWLRMAGEDTRIDPEHFTVPPNWISSPSNLAYRLYEILKISESFSSENDSGVSDMQRYNSVVHGSNFVILRSCEEFEGDSLRLLQEKLYRIPVIPIGLLPPSEEEDTSESKIDLEWAEIKKWLDKQREGSVVYIAFGSEAQVSREELHEVALGLELSGLPFFWTLRRPTAAAGSSEEVETLTMLPSGFESRNQGGQGFICLGWAPQRRILGHPSVGVFLSHCGWSSVIEALAIGCPLVLLPLSIDQPLVARLLVSKNIGVEIPRDERDGSFTRDSVAKSLRLVIVDDTEGKLHKTKARKMREVFGDKAGHDRYMDDFDQYLRINHGC